MRVSDKEATMDDMTEDVAPPQRKKRRPNVIRIFMPAGGCRLCHNDYTSVVKLHCPGRFGGTQNSLILLRELAEYLESVVRENSATINPEAREDILDLAENICRSTGVSFPERRPLAFFSDCGECRICNARGEVVEKIYCPRCANNHIDEYTALCNMFDVVMDIIERNWETRQLKVVVRPGQRMPISLYVDSRRVYKGQCQTLRKYLNIAAYVANRKLPYPKIPPDWH